MAILFACTVQPPFPFDVSLSFIPVLLVAVFWTVPATVFLCFYRFNRPWGHSFRKKGSKGMERMWKGRRIELGQPDFDAQTKAFRDKTWKGPAERLRARMTESPREVQILVPYAEVTVDVEGGEGPVPRRCSLNLN